jgi:mannose-1-phosphate guanylyltransferase/mannose-6-phosphate isomerase
MEKAQNVAVVPLDAAWNDIGSFAALWEDSAHDAEGNSLQGDVLVENSRNCYVNAQQRLVAIVGADDLVVVETADAVLVAPRHAVQDVKKIVTTLKKQKRPESNSHRRVYRPWGYYESIDQGQRYQVKRIGVNPAASLSLQMHYHRAEHWIVVNGTAEVTCDDKVYLVTENQSTYIPLGHKHRLRNVGKTMLEMIEVQSGSYLGEDDIVRFEDVYGRS